MSTQLTTTKSLFGQKSVQARFEELLGEKAPGFITSVLQVVNSNKLLQNADPQTVLNAAAMGAALDLPINNNLGFAWIVPYKGQAQFQMGWRGFVQLAQRTGLYRTISACAVYEGQLIEENPLDGPVFDWSAKTSDNVIGYAAKISLTTGFEKVEYWSIEKMIKHGQRYSQSFKSGPWQTHFDEMACKTILKNTINRYGPLSIEMQKAIRADQGVIQDLDGNDVRYIDNEPEEVDKSLERALLMIEQAETVQQLDDIESKLSDELKPLCQDAIDFRHEEIKEGLK